MVYPGENFPCSGVIREDLAHLYISVPYIRWYCRCRYGLNPGSSDEATVSLGPTWCHPGVVKDVPRCRPGLVPVYHGSPRYDQGSPRYGHGSPRNGHGSPRCSLGLSRSVVSSVLIICASHQGGVIRIGWFQSVPEIK